MKTKLNTMRSLILLFIILFSFSCNENNEKTIEFLDKGVEQGNYFIEKQNNVIFTEFARGIEENPGFVRKWKNKSDSIYNKYMKLDEEIYFIKSQLDSNLSVQNQKGELFDAVSEYHKLLKSIIPDSLAHRIFKLKDVLKQSDLSIVNLTLLINKISISTHHTLRYLVHNIEHNYIKANKMCAVVTPEKRFLKPGDIYKAEIRWLTLDTTIQPIVIVENDTLKVLNGIAKYKSPPNESIGKKTLSGRIEYKAYDGGILNFPFVISYKVIKP